VILSCSSCKKTPADTDTEPNLIDSTTIPINCGLNVSDLKVDGMTLSIIKDTTYVSNARYISEHEVNAGNGLIIFTGKDVVPEAGFYTVTNDLLSISPVSQSVYVRYFRNGMAFTAQGGRLEIKAAGAVFYAYACDLMCEGASSDTHIVSFRTMFN